MQIFKRLLGQLLSHIFRTPWATIVNVTVTRLAYFKSRLTKRRKQASKFIRQNNIVTILIQDVNNTTAGYQKEILPSSWSHSTMRAVRRKLESSDNHPVQRIYNLL